MNNQEYINNFKESNKRVNNFAFRSLSSGVKLLLMPQPDHDNNPERHPDEGDMMILGRIEHKVRALDFTSRDDYPYQTVNIDEVYKVKNKKDKALMYIIENSKGTHAAIVYSYTYPYWKIKDYYDWKRSRNIVLFTIDKKYVRFCKIDEVF